MGGLRIKYPFHVLVKEKILFSKKVAHLLRPQPLLVVDEDAQWHLLETHHGD